MAVIVDELITQIRVGGAGVLRTVRSDMAGLVDTWSEVAAVVTAGSAAVLAGALSFAQTADAQIKQARSVATSVESHSALAEALAYSGIQAEQARPILVRYLKTFADAGDGVEAMRDALHAVGIEGEALARALEDPAAALPSVIDGLKAIEEPAKRARTAMQLFGEEGGPRMASAIDAGGDAMRAALLQARAFGVVIDTETGVAAEGLNDALDRMRARARGLGYTFYREIVPPLERLATGTERWIDTKLPRWLDVASIAGQRFGLIVDGLGSPVGRLLGLLTVAGAARTVYRFGAGLSASGAAAGSLSGALPQVVRDVGSFATAGGRALIPWLALGLAVDDVAGSLSGERGLTTALFEAAGAGEGFEQAGRGVRAQWAAFFDILPMGIESLWSYVPSLDGVAGAARRAGLELSRIPGFIALSQGLIIGSGVYRDVRERVGVDTDGDGRGDRATLNDALGWLGDRMERSGAVLSGAAAQARAREGGATAEEAQRIGQLRALQVVAQGRDLNVEITIDGAQDPDAIAAQVRREIEALADEAANR